MANLDMQLADKLKTLLKQTALSVTEQQQQQLVKLVSLLNKWNKAYNLTSVRDPQEMLVKHIIYKVTVLSMSVPARACPVCHWPLLIRINILYC